MNSVWTVEGEIDSDGMVEIKVGMDRLVGITRVGKILVDNSVVIDKTVVYSVETIGLLVLFHSLCENVSVSMVVFMKFCRKINIRVPLFNTTSKRPRVTLQRKGFNRYGRSFWL